MCKREYNNLSVGYHKCTSQLASILYHNEVRLSNIWRRFFKIFRGIFFGWAAGYYSGVIILCIRASFLLKNDSSLSYFDVCTIQDYRRNCLFCHGLYDELLGSR